MKGLTPEQKEKLVQELRDRLKKPDAITNQQRSYYRTFSPYRILDDPYAQKPRRSNLNPRQRSVIDFGQSSLQSDYDQIIIDQPIFYGL